MRLVSGEEEARRFEETMANGTSDSSTNKAIMSKEQKDSEKDDPICDVCGTKVVFNLHIYKMTGMCGACTTGEARLNFEEEIPDNSSQEEL